MQISNAYVQSGASEWAKKVSAGDSHAKKEATPKTKAASDKVSISADAEKNSSSEALVMARANALPETREEKINVARERIESGYYNTPEFSRELAENLVEG
ncbi:MAG: flagellar biosynthesis anti-sigma factor FlgM [Candidatus Fibromonas sp.]|jgi:anti-sigma28 factor (negative regulator of flagellin synthesis)|nr:flagellar biosynthesis anti-sigma factor FlgM [Candidatus Fibromonas sp.]